MDPYWVARRGIARTFQSLALFKGMSVLDNILAGRNLMMRTNILLQALRIGPALKEEIHHRQRVEADLRERVVVDAAEERPEDHSSTR